MDSTKSGDLDKVEQFSKIINSSAHQGSFLLDNLLDWTRSERGMTLFNPEDVRVKDILDEISDHLNLQILEKNIDLIICCPENLSITADINMLQTILRNLISQ